MYQKTQQNQNVQSQNGVSFSKNTFIATFTGRLSKDAKASDSQKGYHYVQLNILSNVVPQPTGGYRPLAIQARVFQPLAKFAEKLKKGDKVLVTGSVTDLQHWTAKSGEIHTCINLNVNEIELQMHSKSVQNANAVPQAAPQQAPQYAAPVQQYAPQSQQIQVAPQQYVPQYAAPAPQAAPQQTPQYVAPAQAAPQYAMASAPQAPAPQQVPQSGMPFSFDEGEAPMAF